MIIYLLNTIYNHKRRKIILGYLIILMITFFLMMKSESSFNEQLAYMMQERYNYQYKLLEFVKFFMPLTLGMLMMEHDQGHIRALIPYVGRTKVMLAKIIVYTSIVGIIYFFMFAFYVMYAKYFTAFYHPMLPFNADYMYMFLSSLIFAEIILIVVREKHRMLIFLLVLFHIIYTIIQEQQQHIALFYLLPISGHYFKNYELTIYYQCVFIVLLIFINLYIAKKEQLMI